MNRGDGTMGTKTATENHHKPRMADGSTEWTSFLGGEFALANSRKCRGRLRQRGNWFRI